jgi:filamentous hemagglutinin family protein
MAMNFNISPICNARTNAAAVKSDMRIFLRSLRLRRNSIFCRVVTGILAFGFAANMFANPTGMTVGHGSASARQNGSQLTVTASQNALLNWKSFNIAADETTTFVQPSATSIVFNQIGGASPSQIYGNLNANGIVVLLNSSGFYFGPNSFVSAAGLVVSTANLAPPENSGGGWEFNGPPPLASIVNYGQIQIGKGGSAFLIADQVENHGTIEAPGGTIGLAAGQTVLLSERPDGRGMSMQVTLPQGSVDNSGNLVADAGTIALQAQVVNQNGIIQADSVQNQNGVIELVASDQLNLGANSQILARGDDSMPSSSGGNVTLQSGNNFSDSVGSQIVTSGGANGGNGGNVEVSAPNILSLNSSMDAGAESGWSGGTFFLDPANIILGTSGSGTVPANGTIASGSNPGMTLSLNVNTAFLNKNFDAITLQATANITINSDTTWNLSASTGQSSGALTLEAGGNIIFSTASSSSAKITDAKNWSVTLDAGYNFANNTVNPGVGNIFLNGGTGLKGGGSIQTASGDVNLIAGQSITVGKGFVNTTGGGDIMAHALKGDINTGTFAQGYVFQSASVPSQGYHVDFSKGLGGMSTAAGGNVSLTAGGNVISLLPGSGGVNDGTTGSGAYGSQAGNVTVVAGGNVTGHYLVANGIGNIYAGVVMDASGNPEIDSSGNYVLGVSGSAGTSISKPNFALSLINGGWNVDAAQNIILEEVRNPNGDFNINGGAAFHYFDYGPNDYVNLSAGNLVQLGAAFVSLPRGADSLNVPVIYPPILNISAGAGGVDLIGDSPDNTQLILFPSPEGSLAINTTQGGSLFSTLDPVNNTPQIFSLIVSDSGRSQYTGNGDFGLNDHADTPIHLNNPTPIDLSISGDMSLVLLGAPEAAQINVGGDMNNSRFQGMNLSADPNQSVQVPVREIDGGMGMATIHPGLTSINVTGDINNRSAFTSVTLDLSPKTGEQAPDLSFLSEATSGNPSAATLVNSLYYNSTTGVFTYQNISGVSFASVLALLQSLPIQTGVDKNGNPITSTASVINAATAKALLEEYNKENIESALELPYVSDNPNDGPDDNPNPVSPPAGAAGYTIGGGGKFQISAQTMDLGTTAGIQSMGVGLYTVGSTYPLASIFDKGADISVSLSGDLNMYSTSIASLNDGAINVNVGGEINVGSADFNVITDNARGIYTSAQSDVTVIAGGDININGSRIAAYDGGNVTVESLNRDINAGTGAFGYVILNAFYVDPTTHAVFTESPTIPGSGILATTFPARDASYPAPPVTVGNILAEAPNGNVNADAGGIIQLALNTSQKKKDKEKQVLTSIVEVLSGFELRDSMGNPVVAANIANGTPVSVSDARNIDVSGSGVIAQNAVLDASGDITGVIFAQGNINISAVANVNVTALAQGTVSASAGGDISGTIIGIGGITASGSSIDASLLSQNVTASGDTSGATEGFAQGTAANATSQGMSNASQTAASASEDTDDPDDLKKKKGITLAQKVGRVTVVLPAKALSENQTTRNPL